MLNFVNKSLKASFYGNMLLRAEGLFKLILSWRQSNLIFKHNTILIQAQPILKHKFPSEQISAPPIYLHSEIK